MDKKLKGVPYGSDKLPVLGEADVVVVGAGPGGLGAALAAAWHGERVLVAEEYGVPGGMAVLAEVHPFMRNATPAGCNDFPVYGQWKEAMKAYLPPRLLKEITQPNDYSCYSINKSAAALAAEDLLVNAGVNILYHHSVVGVQMGQGNRISGLICHTRGGFGILKGKCYVDCTGDANVAAMAGCPFEMGDSQGGCQPMTLCFKLSHVDIPFVEGPYGGRLLSNEWKKSVSEAFNKAQQEGRIHCPRENVLVFPFQLSDEHTLHFNTTRVIGYDATNGADFSKAEMEGRRQLREIVAWLRAEVPGFAEARLMSMAVQIGVRESRRVEGLYKLKFEDFENCARFEDAIARCSYNVDIHSPRGAGTQLIRIKPSQFYEIPYRCTVPLKCSNLTIGGRPISADVAMHSSLRIMPCAISIGQGAGMGAAMAVAGNLSPAEVNGCEVRQKLIEFGAHLMPSQV